MEPVKELLPADQLAEKQAAKAEIKAEDLLQELSRYHWAENDPSKEASECAEITEQEKQDLISTYIDAVYDARLASQMPIDFSSAGWNMMPEAFVAQCFVADPAHFK